MNKTLVVNPEFKSLKPEIKKAIANFETGDKYLGNPNRNQIKVIDIGGMPCAVKSFKVPNAINQIAYKYFRKSKAERSFLYANIILEKGIKTPAPIAFKIDTDGMRFTQSYYISKLVNANLTYRELTNDFKLKSWEDILRSFTRFTYKLHENNINFLDHSPGNTLIVRNGADFDFYLVDLNRMQFGKMSMEQRISNFKKLTIHKNMIEIMSDEYAKVSGEDYDQIFKLMWQSTQDFQEKYHRKRRLKNKLLFWRAKK